MSKFRRFGLFATGIIVGVILSVATTALAVSVIKSAEYNSNKVVFDGAELELSAPLVSIIDEDNPGYFANYMPVRAVLEAMGYDVAWDGEKSAVIVSTPVVDDVISPAVMSDLLAMLDEEYEIKSDSKSDDKGVTVTLTKGELEATITYAAAEEDDAAITAKIVCGDKEAEFEVTVSEDVTYVLEDALMGALEEVGLLD